ncbi:MAG: ComEC/Rec2 family competence protein [Desulfitobacteriaceae bacterium]
MRDLWTRRVVAFLIGGVGGTFFSISVGLWVLGILSLFIVRIWFWRPKDFWGHILRPEFLLIGVGVVVAFTYGMTIQHEWPKPLSLKYIQLSGVLLDWSETPDKASGLFRVEDGTGDKEILAELRGQKYRLTVYPVPGTIGQFPAGWQQVQPGDYLSFATRLERPKSLGTPGGFDLQLYDAIRGLQGSLTAQGEVTIVVQGLPSLTWLIRKQVREVLSIWDRSETGVLEGIIFGDSSGISPNLQERYRITGVLHIFAASGSNVAFVLGLLWLLTALVPLGLRVGLCTGGLIGYATLCGGNAPILRATILGVAVLMGRLGHGRVPALRWLMFAAAGLFVQNPLVVKDLGFQLSFVAAWGIIVLGPKIQAWRILKNLPRPLSLVIAGTLAAQIAILPLLITAFHRLSLVGFIANLVILLIIGSVFELGLIGVMFSFSPVLAAPLFQVSLWLLQITNAVLAQLALLPWAEVFVLQPGLGFWLGWYGGITVWLVGRKRFAFIVKIYLRRFWRGVLFNRYQSFYPVCINQFLSPYRDKFGNNSSEYWPLSKKQLSWSLIALLALLLWSPWKVNRTLEVTFLDVGQGDSIIIQTPKRHTILLDAGPRSERFDTGEKVIVPYLLQNGVNSLDAVIITHEHLDHLGGVQAVLSSISVDWVGVPAVGDRLNNPEWRDGLISDTLSSSGRLRMLQSGDRVILDSGVSLEVLAPAKVLNGTHSDPNNNSLVFKLNYLKNSILLTGDMEREEMEEIAATGVNYEADFFKVPHHGSEFSLVEPWLDAVHPQAVIISVGKNNFGHPSPKILQYWTSRQIPIYRTDQDGSIKLRFDDQGAELTLGRVN